MDLAGALGLGDSELVSFVGAGGKKTAMATLVAEGTGTRRIGYTTSAHMPPPPDIDLVVESAEDIEPTLRERLDADTPLAFASEHVENPSRVESKVEGFTPKVIDTLHESGLFDWLLVKADGARMREFKAPDVDEPPIPERSSVVVPVASAAAIGEPLTERIVHRPERVATIAPIAIGDIMTPEIVGRVLASEDGGCKHVPDSARVVPIINKADDEAAASDAREALHTAISLTERFDRGLVTSFENGTIATVSA